jgi:hypothetical protein
MTNPDLVGRYDVIVREFMNGCWFIIALIFFCYLVYYMIRRFQWAQEWWETAPEPKPGIFRVWYNWDGVRLALAVSIVVMGDIIRAGWVFLILNQRIQTSEPAFIINWWPAGLLAVTFVLVGTLCCIRVLSERKTDWIVAALAAVAGVAIIEWVTR